MARIRYDAPTAAAFTEVRAIPRAALTGWRDAVRRHVRPAPGTTVVDLGAGTGVFTAAFADWFGPDGVDVVAVEPSSAMRERIPPSPSIRVLEGDAAAVPLPDRSADAVWLSLVIHHVADLAAAAREVRRVLRPGAPVLVRQGFPGRLDGVELVRWFPETARTVDDYPSLDATRAAFAAAGLHQDALEPVVETYPTGHAHLLEQVDALRRADSTMRRLTEDEFRRGTQRLRRAVDDAQSAAEARSNQLDLLVLR